MSPEPSQQPTEQVKATPKAVLLYVRTTQFAPPAASTKIGYESEETPYRNLFLTSSGLITADESFRHNDENEVKNHFPWSEIIYYTWKVAQAFANRQHKLKPERMRVGGESISNLQTIVRAKIENDQTIAVIEAIYKANGLKWNVGDPE
ncbi:MAG: hypothetical protein Q9181_002364 [Wetmoreana brouardii]